jgi:hypothetical protein
VLRLAGQGAADGSSCEVRPGPGPRRRLGSGGGPGMGIMMPSAWLGHSPRRGGPPAPSQWPGRAAATAAATVAAEAAAPGSGQPESVTVLSLQLIEIVVSPPLHTSRTEERNVIHGGTRLLSPKNAAETWMTRFTVTGSVIAGGRNPQIPRPSRPKTGMPPGPAYFQPGSGAGTGQDRPWRRAL